MCIHTMSKLQVENRKTIVSSDWCIQRERDQFIAQCEKVIFFPRSWFSQKNISSIFQAKTEMQAALEEYPYHFLNDSAISIQYKNLLNHY